MFTPAKASKGGRGAGNESLLLGWLVGKGDTLLDVALQALDGGLQQRLLLGGDVPEDVDGLLGSVGLINVSADKANSRTQAAVRGKTYAELDGDREEVDADLLGDLLASRDTGEVDVTRLHEALGALDSLEELLGEPGKSDQLPAPAILCRTSRCSYL